MLNKFLGKAETGKLIVTAIAVCVDPTGIAAAGFGADAVIHIRDKLMSNNAGLVALSKEIDAAFTEELKKPSYKKPDEAREILPQMLRVALSKPGAFVEQGLEADDILDELCKHFKSQDADADHRRLEMITAFRKLYRPLLHMACNDPRLKAAIDPALYREQRKDLKETKQEIRTVASDITDVKNNVENMQAELEKQTSARILQEANAQYAQLFATISAENYSPGELASLIHEMAQAKLNIADTIGLIRKKDGEQE